MVSDPMSVEISYSRRTPAILETDILLSGTTPVRLDRVPLAFRTTVTVVNPDQTNRVFIAHSQANATDAAEISGGPTQNVWEDDVGTNVQIWAVSEGGASVVVRLKQWS
jgi:hypothetical protein